MAPKDSQQAEVWTYKLPRGILIAGVILGFGSGLADLGTNWRLLQEARQQRVVDMCVESALRTQQQLTHTTPALLPASAELVANHKPTSWYQSDDAEPLLFSSTWPQAPSNDNDNVNDNDNDNGNGNNNAQPK